MKFRLVEAGFNAAKYQANKELYINKINSCQTLDELTVVEQEIISKVKKHEIDRFLNMDLTKALNYKKEQLNIQAANSEEQNIYNSYVDKANNKFGTNQLFYHTDTFNSLNQIIDSTYIQCSAEDYDGTGHILDTNFICVSKDASRHILRNNNKWRYGISLDCAKLLRYIDNEKTDFVINDQISWIKNNLNRQIKSLEITNRSIRLVDLANDNIISFSDPVPYYLISFYNCPPVPISKEIFNEIIEYIDNNPDKVQSKFTSEKGDKILKYGVKNKKWDLFNFILADLPDNIIQDLTDNSLYNEKEVRISLRSKRKFKLPIDKLMIGVVVDESISPYLYGGKFADIELDLPALNKLISSKQIDISKKDAADFLIFRQNCLEEQWPVYSTSYKFYN